jgi:hypothetical protein
MPDQPATPMPQPAAAQLPLPGVPPGPPIVQGRFVAAAQYASLTLQVCEHLFPDLKIFGLSQDQRRILADETDNLLLQARWRIETKVFADKFAWNQSGVEMAPPGTVLGSPVPKTQPAATPPGQYL